MRSERNFLDEMGLGKRYCHIDTCKMLMIFSIIWRESEKIETPIEGRSKAESLVHEAESLVHEAESLLDQKPCCDKLICCHSILLAGSTT